MMVRQNDVRTANSDNAEGSAAPSPPARRGRRAATSMEYVVMASFILMVVIGAVQYFGFSVGNLFTANAAATTRTQNAAQNSP